MLVPFPLSQCCGICRQNILSWLGQVVFLIGIVNFFVKLIDLGQIRETRNLRFSRLLRCDRFLGSINSNSLNIKRHKLITITIDNAVANKVQVSGGFV